VIVGLTLIGTSYLALWGLHHENFRAFGIGVIFSILGFIAILVYYGVENGVLGRGVDIPIESTFRTSAFWFVAGIVFWTIAASFGTIYGTDGKPQSIAFGPMSLLNSGAIAKDGMSEFWHTLTNVITAPTIEEMFFLIALPIAMFTVFERLKFSRELSFFAVVFTVPIVFATFHVGFAGVIVFIVAAALFRFIMLTLHWGDARVQLFQLLDVSPAFALGAHVANNIITTKGYIATFHIFMAHPFGIVILGFFGLTSYYAMEAVAFKLGVIEE
jgi:hypothetical protein